MSDQTSLLTAELIVDGALPRQPVISPDGRWVAYVVTTIGDRAERERSALWLAAADGSSPPRQLTAGNAADSDPRWAPDCAAVFFVSDRTGSAQVHRIQVDGGEAEALTDWAGEIGGVCPLADARGVAVLATDEPTPEHDRRRAERDDAIVWEQRVPPSGLRLLDLRTRKLLVADALGDRHVVEVAPRPDGGPLAVLTWATPQIDPGMSTAALHVVQPETGACCYVGPVGLEAGSLAWWQADDGWHLAYLAITPPGSIGGFAVFDVTPPQGNAGAAVAVAHRNLTAGMTVCPTYLIQVTHGPPLALFADGLDTAIYELHPGIARFQRVSSGVGQLEALPASASGELVAVLASTAHEPTDVHAGPPGGPLVRLSDTRPELRRVTLGTQIRLSYQASDGLNLDGILVLPAGKSREDGPFPLVTMVHGGPYDRHADECYGGLFVGQTDRFRAALMGAGISDWGMLVGTGHFGTAEAGLGGSCGWEGPGPHRHDQLSPVSFASRVRTPVLILHGQDDTNVPLGQATYFHRALRGCGVEHEFVVYPREGHGLPERAHQLDMLRRVRAWFDRWLAEPARRSAGDA